MTTWSVMKDDIELATGFEIEADAIVWCFENDYGDGGPDDPYRLAKDITIVERAET